MKKKDLILIIFLLLVAISFVFVNRQTDRKKGGFAEIYVDNKLYKEESLNQTKSIKIEKDGKINELRIHDGGIEMVHANCPDKVCVHTGFISKPSQSIVCIPHKVQIKIKASDRNDKLDTSTN